MFIEAVIDKVVRLTLMPGEKFLYGVERFSVEGEPGRKRSKYTASVEEDGRLRFEADKQNQKPVTFCIVRR